MKQSYPSMVRWAFTRLDLPIYFLLIFCFSASSHAVFVLQIDDDLDPLNGRTTVFDGDNDGVITHSGGFGAFTVNVTTGLTQPALSDPAKLDLNSVDVTGSTGGTLYIWLSATDFTGSLTDFTADFGGTTQGTVTLDFLHDPSNTLFGGTSFAFADSPSWSTGGTSFGGSIIDTVVPASPYSLTILATIEHPGGGQVSSFDALVSAVPVPAAAWLFASAVISIAGLRRLRK